jgi:cell division protein FtsA
MSHSKIITGLDIGTSKITTILGQYFEQEDKLNIIAASSIPATGFKKGQIINLEQACETITQSVESAERMAGFQINEISVAITAPHIESINSKGVVGISNPNGEIDNNDINRAIEAAKAVSLPTGKEILHVIPRIFTVDGQEGIVDPIGMNGVRMEIEAHLVIASSPAIKNLQKCLEEIGLKIKDLTYSGFVSAKASLTDTEQDLGVALIDIGGSNTTITLFIEGSPAYSHVLPIGANNITNDIAIGLRQNIEDAEKIKLKLAKIYDNKKFTDEIDLSHFGIPSGNNKISIQTTVNGIIKPRLEELFSLIKEKIEDSSYAKNIPAGIVLTGGGALTVNAKEICQKIINLPVRIAEPKKIGGIIDDISNPAYSSSIGLLLSTLENNNQKNNFSLNTKNKISIKGIFAKIKHLIEPLLP